MRRGASVTALLSLALAACPARAQAPADTVHSQAPADTALGGFLGGLADSTDRYFGFTANPLDTAGLDSALAERLESPWTEPSKSRNLEISWGPWIQFNRVEGTLWGGSLGIGNADRIGKLVGRLGWAAGPNEVRGGGEYRLARERGENTWRFSVWAGRLSESMDRDHQGRWLSMVRALVAGSDHSHYLLRDGVRARVERETPGLRLGLGYRDQLERALATTTTWNFLDHVLDPIENLAATRGRAREVEARVAARVPHTPFQTEAALQVTSPRLGGAFAYRRYRLALAGDIPLAQRATLVPQLLWGRLDGDLVRQASFFIGGPHTLRSVQSGTAGGTAIAVARLDVIAEDDLLSLLRIPHPDAFSFQPGAFAGIGAAWGRDPYGGPTRPGRNFPEREAWLSEVGLSLLYRPGLPEPDGFLRFDVAQPLGPDDRSLRFVFSYGRAIDLLKPLE
jgi:hypothetical protein